MKTMKLIAKMPTRPETRYIPWMSLLISSSNRSGAEQTWFKSTELIIRNKGSYVSSDSFGGTGTGYAVYKVPSSERTAVSVTGIESRGSKVTG
jgi:hypothetical protein